MRKTSDDEIRRLKLDTDTINVKYDETIHELNRTQSELQGVSTKIRIERMPAVPKMTTVFESDPAIVERNRHLAEELELAIVDLP